MPLLTRFVLYAGTWVAGLAGSMDAATVRGKIARNAGYPISYMKVSLRGTKVSFSPIYTGSDGLFSPATTKVAGFLLRPLLNPLL